jgi:hypothetical protein
MMKIRWLADMSERDVTEEEVWTWLLDELTPLMKVLFSRKPPKPVTRDTDLLDDLGITGEDAVEFLTKFVERFDIQPGNFDIAKHFDSEGDFVVRAIWRLFRPLQLYHTTVGDLVDVAMLGRFDLDYTSRPTYKT